LKKKTTMPPVNVDNLMRELSIDQLIQVQIKLRYEMIFNFFNPIDFSRH